MPELIPDVLAAKVRALRDNPHGEAYAAGVLAAIGIDPTGDRETATAQLATYLAACIDVQMLGRDPQEVALHGPSDAARLKVAEVTTATSDLLEADDA